ncbi:GNAT family N-acetyltransferase [Kordiimonas sp. SCSIO 12610]|uniref:GNAT family N-acetyltransferase n=1 Tax=Kordiimonas sp. SCSIO 12610 TaxID=2829597 RepID=UPI00210CED60|nr:GNAT family protein [Kordiimonas sp. SCSIO 12610]UTW56416.1 GNAT family N-acetyltransferase [Kordiimonas sp. SCSIO 12610]
MFWKKQTDGPINFLSQEEIWSRYLRFIGHWHRYNFGAFCITAKNSHTIIGEAGTAYFKRGINDQLDQYPEAFWRPSTDVRGQGYAAEAMLAILSWVDTQPSPKTVNAIIDQENTASIKVALNLGFQRYGSDTYKSSDVDLYRRSKQ